jgi:hypothetical protein
LDHASFGAGLAAFVIALERALHVREADIEDQPHPETIGPHYGQDPDGDTDERSGMTISAADAADIEHASPDTGGMAGPGQSTCLASGLVRYTGSVYRSPGRLVTPCRCRQR